MARQGHLRALCASVLIAASAALLVPVAADASYAVRTLKLRSHGSDVKQLQTYLTKAGYKATADGYYGKKTRAAERSFARTAAASPAPAQATTPSEHATIGPDGRTAIAPDSAPQQVKDVMAAANAI